MAYNVNQAFRERCYSGSSLYRCRLIIGEETIPVSQISSITISSPIVDGDKETFYIGTFISQKLTIQFKNLDGINTESGTNVELYISQYVEGNWVEVPIGKYIIDESPEDYYKSSKIDCLDYAIKFATNLDYSSALVDDKITIDNLLIWICNHYGITLGDYPTINGDVEIGTYDNTISGKRWISYIAELKGCNAKMNRNGELTLVPLKSPPAVTINALRSKSWELGEKFEVSKVVYFDAIRNFTFGDDTSNTLYIRQENPFVVDETVVENIYNSIEGTVIWSLKCENYGDISLDSWDHIAYTLGEATYETLNNNTITYEMTIMSKVETKIPTKQQEVTTNVVGGTEEQIVRRVQTTVNNVEGRVNILTEEVGEQGQKVSELEVNTEEISSTVSQVENQVDNNYQELLAKFDDIASTDDITALQELVRQIQTNTYTKTEIQQIASGVAADGTEVSYVKTTSATFDEDGMHYEKSGANTSSTVNQTGITVNDTSGSSTAELLFAGYDSIQQEALVRVANLYLTRYLGLSNWRIEQITDSTYGTGIGFFYLG